MLSRSRALTGHLLVSAVLIGACSSALAAAHSAIAFTSARDTGNWQIVVMDADGGNQRSLSNPPNDDEWPTWSSDGRRVAFVHTGHDALGNGKMYVMDADGGNRVDLSDVVVVGGPASPAWSPDGRTIAFSGSLNRDTEILLIGPDGANLRNITNHPDSVRSPAWSPDGRSIAFTTSRDGNGEVYVMDADGGNQRNITNHPSSAWTPVWSPDGKSIAFTTNRDGNWEIYLMDSDGGNQRNISNHLGPDTDPDWHGSSRPRGVQPSSSALVIWGALKWVTR